MIHLMVYTAVQLQHEERRNYTGADAVVLGNYTNEISAVRACFDEADTASDGCRFHAIRHLPETWEPNSVKRDVCQLMAENWQENVGEDGEPDPDDVVYTFSIWYRPLED